MPPPPQRRPRSHPRAGAARPQSRHDPRHDPARTVAYEVLRAVADRQAYANLLLPRLLRRNGVTGRDAGLATELAYGTLRRQGTLDLVVAACSDRPPSAVDPQVLDLLRLGSYQLLHTRVPTHAAVSTTVDLARAAVGQGPSRFVNAVLRRVADRDEQGWVEALAPPYDTDPVGHLAVRHAHPEWIVAAFRDALGGDLAETEAALAADDAPPAVHLAALPGRVDADALAQEAGGARGPWSPFAVRLAGGDPGRLAALRAGLAQVQDEGSQLCARALADAPLAGGDTRWLDVCAGPGGKAALLGAIARVRGGGRHVLAADRSAHRTDLVRRATGGLPVAVVTADGTTPPWPSGAFDRALVDAPCTGLGALRRRPEARWRRQPSDVPALTAIQRGLLTRALEAVRPGGVVCYVTCSPHPAETRAVVVEVCRRTGAVPLDARPVFPGVPHLGEGPHVQLWPHRHGTDAMFCALLARPER